jgi:Bacterial Ig domain
VKSTRCKGVQVPFKTGLLALALGLAGVGTGCGVGDEEAGTWAPSGVGPQIDTETAALKDQTAGAPMAGSVMDGDMVAMPPQAGGDVERVQGALTSSGRTGDPKVFYLFYATGKDLPYTDANACKGTPPKFNCTFAPTLAECQRQIQAYLDRWYADFNIIFTLTRPTSGKFYTEVVSSGGGAWCDVSPKVAGVAPFLCKDIDGGVAYTFLGGTSAKQTAIIIAQEQAHLVGLEHTTSKKDLMFPSICSDCDDGFRDEDLVTDGDRCDRSTQNSYEMLKDRLGAWGGGAKPSAFGCMNDLRAPSVTITEPKDGAMVKEDFSLKVNATDDCDLASVQVQIMPQALKATSYAPPFEWDLNNITGEQTITVTAVDGFGHVTQKIITVTAPMAKDTLNSMSGGAAGCTVGSSAFGLAGLLPALGALVIFSRRRHPARRRAVTGALRNSPRS